MNHPLGGNTVLGIMNGSTKPLPLMQRQLDAALLATAVSLPRILAS